MFKESRPSWVRFKRGYVQGGLSSWGSSSSGSRPRGSCSRMSRPSWVMFKKGLHVRSRGVMSKGVTFKGDHN